MMFFINKRYFLCTNVFKNTKTKCADTAGNNTKYNDFVNRRVMFLLFLLMTMGVLDKHNIKHELITLRQRKFYGNKEHEGNAIFK